MIGTPVDDGLEALANSLAALDDPSGHEVLLYEIDDRGRRSVLCKISPSEFDAFTIAEEWGGGNYCAQVRESGEGKRIVTQRNFAVSAAIRGKRRDGATPRAAGVEAKADQGILSIALAMMQQSAQQSQAMMGAQAQLLTAVLTRPNELAGLLPTLIQPKPANDIAQLISGLRALDELRGGDAGEPAAAESSGELSWLGPPLAALVQGFLSAQKPGATTPTPQGPRKPVPSTAAPPPRPAPSRPIPAEPADKSSSAPPRPPATAALSSAVVGEARGGRADECAPIELTRDQVRAAVIARLVLGADIDADALSDQLAQTLHDASLEEFVAAVPRGKLADVLLDGVPAELSAIVAGDPDRLAALAQLETELRRIVGDIDDSAAAEQAQPEEVPA